MTTADYNSEPVFYCRQCLSLKIFNIPKIEDSEFCEDCGSTDIGINTIDEWESMYETRNGFKYINNKL